MLFGFPGYLQRASCFQQSIVPHEHHRPLSASSACLEKPSCWHILIRTDAFVHHRRANLISRGSWTRHQTKAFKLKKKTEVPTSHVLAWTWAGSSMATGPKQSAVNNRTWLILILPNSPLLGRNMAGTMEECEFPCFSIKPSAYQGENNTSKEWWRPGLMDRRSHTDIRSCVCAGVEPFMKWCRRTRLKKSIPHLGYPLNLGASKQAFPFSHWKCLACICECSSVARTATLSSPYQMSQMKNEVTFDWWGYFKQHQLRFFFTCGPSIISEHFILVMTT